MSLVKCPECNNKISDNAETCPKCGHIFQRKPNLFFVVVGWIVILMFLCALLSG